MKSILIAFLVIQIVFIGLMLIKMFKKETIFDKMNGLNVINSDVIISLLVIGFIDGRPEMYIDIALAYSILGFVSSIVIAKYLGGHKDADK